MNTPYYFVAYEAYDKAGTLRLKGYKTVQRAEKISTDAAFKDLKAFVLNDPEIPAKCSLVLTCITLLNP